MIKGSPFCWEESADLEAFQKIEKEIIGLNGKVGEQEEFSNVQQ